MVSNAGVASARKHAISTKMIPDAEYILPGTVYEYFPEQEIPGMRHWRYDDKETLGCWCSPTMFAYGDEDGMVAYFVVDHNWVQ